jgi:hypothetical protein
MNVAAASEREIFFSPDNNVTNPGVCIITDHGPDRERERERECS